MTKKKEDVLKENDDEVKDKLDGDTGDKDADNDTNADDAGDTGDDDTGDDDTGGEEDDGEEDKEMSIVKAVADGDLDRAKELIRQKATSHVVDAIRGL